MGLICTDIWANSPTQINVQYGFKQDSKSLNTDKMLKFFGLPTVTSSTDSVNLKKTIYNKLIDKGYFLADFLMTKVDSDHLNIEINLNQPITFGKLNLSKSEAGFLIESGVNNNSLNGKILSANALKITAKQVLKTYENNGYPFAELRFLPDSFNEVKSQFTFSLKIKKNQMVTWDSVYLDCPDSTIDYKFIQAYLNIKKGKIYNESLAKLIPARLKELLYIKLTKPPTIIILYNKAVLKLSGKALKTNRVNGVLGLAPNSKSNNDKLLLTGEAEIDFSNLFAKGIGLNAKYKNFLAGASQIQVKSTLPYLFNSKYGVGVNFGLLRFDTAYYILDYGLSLQYQINTQDAFRVQYSENSSRLLNPQIYVDTKTKPPYLDLSTRWYTFGFSRNKLDYTINPSSGFYIKTEASLGTKTIIKNVRLDESVYKGLNLSSNIFSGKFEGGVFIKLRKRIVLHQGVLGGYLSDKQALDNQLFRFGGLKTLRGFDEEVFLANTYVLPFTELRFLTDDNSHFQVFANMAYYERKTPSFNLKDTPYGFGLAYNYLTGLGMFNISFAVGTEQNNPLNFNRTKLHLGYINRF